MIIHIHPHIVSYSHHAIGSKVGKLEKETKNILEYLKERRRGMGSRLMYRWELKEIGSSKSRITFQWNMVMTKPNFIPVNKMATS
jgi:hypothetical protein